MEGRHGIYEDMRVLDCSSSATEWSASLRYRTARGISYSELLSRPTSPLQLTLRIGIIFIQGCSRGLSRYKLLSCGARSGRLSGAWTLFVRQYAMLFYLQHCSELTLHSFTSVQQPSWSYRSVQFVSRDQRHGLGCVRIAHCYSSAKLAQLRQAAPSPAACVTGADATPVAKTLCC